MGRRPIQFPPRPLPSTSGQPGPSPQGLIRTTSPTRQVAQSALLCGGGRAFQVIIVITVICSRRRKRTDKTLCKWSNWLLRVTQGARGCLFGVSNDVISEALGTRQACGRRWKGGWWNERKKGFGDSSKTRVWGFRQWGLSWISS